MTMKHAIAIAFSLILTLTGVFAMPPRASAQFDLDLQATEISNQVQKLLNRITRYTTLFTQFTSLDCSAQGMAAGAEATPVDEAAVACNTLNMIGAFKDSYRQLLAAPTDLLNTPVPLPNWRDVLQEADTVTEADIRNVYESGPNAADAAVATFERRRDHADRSVVLAHAQIDAATALSDTLDAAEAVVADLEARNSVTSSGLDKRSLPLRSRARGLSWRSPGFALIKHPLRRPTPTTPKSRGGRSKPGAWPNVQPLKPCGPRNRPRWPSAPTRASTPCMAAIGCIRSLAGTRTMTLPRSIPMKKLFVVLIAFGALCLPGVVRRGRAQDSLQYILMIVNQGTQITNQGLALARMDTHIGQLTGQFEHLKESALGQIGAITDPIADLIAVPTDLLNTARDWHSDFTGQASSLIDALTELDDGTSLSESWRDVLQEADTVTEADIRDIYQSNSNAADAAVATFERQRDHADRSVVLAHARADAAASLAATAAEVQDKIDTVAGENNVSDTALQQAILAGNLSQGQLLAAMAQMEAWDASAAAAEAYNAEVVRRELEARRLAERAALEAQWAQEQATMALGADDRIEAMYGGYRLHPFFSGN